MKFIKLIDDYNSKFIQAKNLHFMGLLPALFENSSTEIEILDLGAGAGKSKNQIAKTLGKIKHHWTGIDVEDSPEFSSRSNTEPNIDFYDGVTLPYDSESFDVIWCHQVLEHVRRPDKVLSEVYKTLKKDGFFMGSVSQLEPYHSRSIFNFTHYGINVLFTDNNLKLLSIKAGVDGLTLMLRSIFGYNTNLNKFFNTESPFNILLEALYSSDKCISKSTHDKMLMIAGHIHFIALRS